MDNFKGTIEGPIYLYVCRNVDNCNIKQGSPFKVSLLVFYIRVDPTRLKMMR